MVDRIELLGKPLEELESLFLEEGKERFRARQVFRWMYRGLENEFGRMTDLSKRFREALEEKCRILVLDRVEESVSSDGTVKFLYSLEDGDGIEAVMIPDDRRRTLCVSTQVGCRMGCVFCGTGMAGYRRSLSSAEIIGQGCHVEKYLRMRGEKVTNVVFMGMGEPFQNYANLMKACALFSDERGPNLANKHIVVSTSGIVPKIIQFADEGHRFRLAISLNATSDSVRNEIMPLNKKWQIGRAHV